eukprot:6498870-Pyramimonas_sp.AAC.1
MMLLTAVSAHGRPSILCAEHPLGECPSAPTCSPLIQGLHAPERIGCNNIASQMLWRFSLSSVANVIGGAISTYALRKGAWHEILLRQVGGENASRPGVIWSRVRNALHGCADKHGCPTAAWSLRAKHAEALRCTQRFVVREPCPAVCKSQGNRQSRMAGLEKSAYERETEKAPRCYHAFCIN